MSQIRDVGRKACCSTVFTGSLDQLPGVGVVVGHHPAEVGPGLDAVGVGAGADRAGLGEVQGSGMPPGLPADHARPTWLAGVSDAWTMPLAESGLKTTTEPGEPP